MKCDRSSACGWDTDSFCFAGHVRRQIRNHRRGRLLWCVSCAAKGDGKENLYYSDAHYTIQFRAQQIELTVSCAINVKTP